MWTIGPIQTHANAILYIHRNMYQNMYLEVGLVEETKGGGKKGKKR
jgi:hypothetical protein